MNKLFRSHLLNDVGKDKAAQIATAYDACLAALTSICPDGREFAIAKTKLEESCFFAKKAMVADEMNHVEATSV